MSETQKVVILARNDDQYKYYKKNARFKNLEVLLKPLPLIGILEQCSLFIGAGGTMTRELAFLGVPTMSVYQDDLLEVDKYLIKKGLIKHSVSPTIEEIDALAMSKGKKESMLNKRGISAFKQIDGVVKPFLN